MTLRENETGARRRVARKHKKPSKAEAERRRQQVERERERVRAAQQQVAAHPDRVLTFRQWCAVNNFSLATGRRLVKAGEGPAIVRLSPRRIGVKESANAQWQASRAR
jgi:predicted DNA-binding transcriptional regulator AlpA